MAVSVSVSPIVSVVVVLFNDTLVGTIGITVTTHSALLFPYSVLTVMVAVPTDTAVTTPVVLTVATLVSLLDHVTF